jgi:hypothetical protein
MRWALFPQVAGITRVANTNTSRYDLGVYSLGAEGRKFKSLRPTIKSTTYAWHPLAEIATIAEVL